MIYDTEDPTLIAQINAEMKLIRDMVVVSELSFVASGAANAGFQVTLKCYAARQQEGSCRRKNVGPVRITRDRITLMDCLKELRRKLEEEHGSCISAVNEHAELNFARSSGYLSMLTRKSTKSLSCTSMSIKLSGLLRLLMCRL